MNLKQSQNVMSKFYTEIPDNIAEFIKKQPIFFVGTAATEGTVNVSPKGMDTFRILDKNRVLWLNLTGSGNETAAHLLQNNRMTIMFCSFEGKPLILRLYGKAKIYHSKNKEWQEYIDLFPKIAGTRQLIEIHIDRIQTSCGYAVPFMEHQGEREQLKNWAEKQGEERLEKYRKDKNSKSIDNFETGLLD